MLIMDRAGQGCGMDSAHVIQTTTVMELTSMRYHMVNVAGTKAMLALNILFLHKFYSQNFSNIFSMF